MLKRVGKSIQQIAEAVAATVEAHVTIVDDQLVRVAGTGPYLYKIQNSAPRDSAFAKVLQRKETIVIENPGQDADCNDCSVKRECMETFEICTPIVWQEQVVGVLGIFAFDQKQKSNIQAKKEQYLNFLHKMSELIASKVGEAVLYDEVADRNNELAAIIRNVHQGVLCVNRQGIIRHINAAACDLLGLKDRLEDLHGIYLRDIWPEALLLKALQEGQDLFDKEEFYNARNRRISLLSTVKLIRQKDMVTGAVGTFIDSEDVQRSAFRVRAQSGYTFDDLIGNSPLFLKVKERARLVAAYDSTVLIVGESGTGKELFARAIHNASTRAEQPFIGINCSAIPETLLESELFGYEPGAFTGAGKNGKPGQIELANRGTFFLDEIGDMPLFLQAKLLRVLQERRLTKVGGITPREIDVRIIAATNQNLEELIEKKMFREDLYYRLNVIPLVLPPLRERKEDIPVFVRYFLDIYNKRFQKDVAGLTPQAMERLLEYDWPGNVRELENIIEYGINFAQGRYIELDDIRDRLHTLSKSNEHKSLKERSREFERQVICEYLDRFGWDDTGKEKTARVLQVSRATLYRKLSQL